MDLNDPTSVAQAAADAFERSGIAHAVYGGLLGAAYGEPRETRDAPLSRNAARDGYGTPGS